MGRDLGFPPFVDRHSTVQAEDGGPTLAGLLRPRVLLDHLGWPEDDRAHVGCTVSLRFSEGGSGFFWPIMRRTQTQPPAPMNPT